jgi:hypothetical protein
MKLINKAHLFLASIIAFLSFTTLVRATTDRELALTTLPVSDNFVLPTVIRIPDPTNCPAGQTPIYTDPKGGEVRCSEANTSPIPVSFLAVGFVSCAIVCLVKFLL